MFSSLRQGSQVYVLQKRDPISLKIGHVTNVISPNTYTTYMPSYSVDINIKVDQEEQTFKQLPGQLNIAYYDNGNTVISDTKEVITSEVENMIKNSQDIIDSIPYHQDAVKFGEDILKQLNPQFAQQKDQEEKINNLETKVGSVEHKIDDIYTMLAKVLNK